MSQSKNLTPILIYTSYIIMILFDIFTFLPNLGICILLTSICLPHNAPHMSKSKMLLKRAKKWKIVCRRNARTCQTNASSMLNSKRCQRNVQKKCKNPNVTIVMRMRRSQMQYPVATYHYHYHNTTTSFNSCAKTHNLMLLLVK